MACDWEPVTLGRSGVSSSALGLGSSFGLATRDVHRAFERGIRYFYWGSVRRPAFGRAVRELAARERERMVVVIQSYARLGSLVGPGLERALRALRIEQADFLLLGWWNQLPPPRILDAARALRDAGKCRRIMISCHHRPSFARYIEDPTFDAVMVRYNAAHTGAEHEVFPHLGERPPGVVAYTATRWGALLDPRLTPAGEATPRASDCYRFALSNPHVDLCLAGPADAAQLDEAMAALDRGPLDDAELAWMLRVGAAVRAASAVKSRRSPAHLWDRLAGALTRDRD